MGKIYVTNIRVYAYHGCLEEEAMIGSDYRVDLEISADLSVSAKSDNLEDTVDYVHLNHIVKEEMKVRSKLLEHVAQRILDRIFLELQLVTQVKIKVAKINPPIGGDVQEVTVVLNKNRT